MEQLSFAAGHKLPQMPDHPMFTAAEPKYIRGQAVKVPLGSIKKRLKKTMERAGHHFYRLDQAKEKRRVLKKGAKEHEATIKWEA